MRITGNRIVRVEFDGVEHISIGTFARRTCIDGIGTDRIVASRSERHRGENADHRFDYDGMGKRKTTKGGSGCLV